MSQTLNTREIETRVRQRIHDLGSRTYQADELLAVVDDELRTLFSRMRTTGQSWNQDSIDVPLASMVQLEAGVAEYNLPDFVADIQKTYRFANASAGKRVDDVRNDVPLLVARSGQDQFPGLNESLDNFVRGALRCNLRMTLVNHADAPHGFDLFHDSDTTREIIRQILTFLRFHLSKE